MAHDDDPTEAPSDRGGTDDRVRSRHVMPLGPRVLVRLVSTEDRTSGGLYLPAGSHDASAEVAYGEVVEVARASSDDEQEGFGTNVSGVPEGARVLFLKDKGMAVPWDAKLKVVDVKDVVALVEEIDREEAH